MAKAKETAEMVHVPDYLLDALALENETGSTDLFMGDDTRLPPLRRIEFPQPNSRKHGGQAGKIFISGLPNTDEEGEYVDYIDLLLMSELTVNRDNASEWMLDDPIMTKHLPAGGRTMWEFDETGHRNNTADAPICTSSNGVEPWRQYRDKEYYDYRLKTSHRIGWVRDESGLPVRMANACVGCPFAKDVTVEVGIDENGQPITQWYSAMCRESFTYVVWDVNRKEMMTMKAVNMGMQFALVGRRNRSGRRFDGEEFKGIKHFFSHNGFHTDPESGDKVALFVNRPQGKPSPKNPNAPVHPVRMSVTLNNFSPQTYVPNFTVLDGKARAVLGVSKKGTVDGSVMFEAPDRALTPEEYYSYLKDMNTFIQDDFQSRMMAMYLVTPTNRVYTGSPQLPGGVPTNPAQLPSGDSTPSDTTQDYDKPF